MFKYVQPTISICIVYKSLVQQRHICLWFIYLWFKYYDMISEIVDVSVSTTNDEPHTWFVLSWKFLTSSILLTSNQTANDNRHLISAVAQHTAICENTVFKHFFLFKHCMWSIRDWRNKNLKNVKIFRLKKCMRASWYCWKLRGRNFYLSMWNVTARMK